METKQVRMVFSIAIMFNGVLDLLTKYRTSNLDFNLGDRYREEIGWGSTPLMCDGPEEEVAAFKNNLLDSCYGNRVYIHKYIKY